MPRLPPPVAFCGVHLIQIVLLCVTQRPRCTTTRWIVLSMCIALLLLVQVRLCCYVLLVVTRLGSSGTIVYGRLLLVQCSRACCAYALAMFALLVYSTTTPSTTSVYLVSTCTTFISCILVYMLLGPAVRSEVYRGARRLRLTAFANQRLTREYLCVILKQ